MQIIIHRGTHQIGGCITEIQSKKGTRIAIDIGENLPSINKEENKNINVEGLNTGEPGFDAVFITHYHGDHIGLYNKIYNGIAYPLWKDEGDMNKTKRKIFEISMKLFAEKGYDATSIEEITATVGVAKGTLYYHFSSKEEIFNFLIEEGMKLLQNSIEIKTSKLPNYIDKLKAIVLIQIKIVMKYEDLITILLSQFYGKEARNQKCQKHVYEYISKIEEIVKEGIENKQIKQGNPKIIASEIYGIIASTLGYKIRNKDEMDTMSLYREFEGTLIEGLKA